MNSDPLGFQIDEAEAGIPGICLIYFFTNSICASHLHMLITRIRPYFRKMRVRNPDVQERNYA